ncbi:MAG: hypothetical protein JNM00_13445, partial [Flavobacteriales bacterium]|nr:hypothetical protein [Flavobacteriales bacterium]
MMKIFSVLFIALILLAGCLSSENEGPLNESKSLRPEEWQTMMRTWPDKKFNVNAWHNGMLDAWRTNRERGETRTTELWQTEGPGNIG